MDLHNAMRFIKPTGRGSVQTFHWYKSRGQSRGQMHIAFNQVLVWDWASHTAKEARLQG